MKTKNSPKTFEERMQRLQTIVTAMEGGNVPLEESVALYKEGMQLSQTCRKQLEKARHDISLYTDGEDKAFTPSLADEQSDDDYA